LIHGDRERRRALARQRRKRHVVRSNLGLVVLDVLADEHRFAQALILSTRRSADEVLNRKVLEAEAASIIEDFRNSPKLNSLRNWSMAAR
jgi:hypothetical protein